MNEVCHLDFWDRYLDEVDHFVKEFWAWTVFDAHGLLTEHSIPHRPLDRIPCIKPKIDGDRDDKLMSALCCISRFENGLGDGARQVSGHVILDEVDELAGERPFGSESEGLGFALSGGEHALPKVAGIELGPHVAELRTFALVTGGAHLFEER